MAKSTADILPLVVMAIVILAVAGGTVYYLHTYVNNPKSQAATLRVVEGDNVTVNYIGTFGSGPDAGKVFDTSLLNIATNNASYPKALSFAFRGDAGYVPLQAHVGPQSYTPYTSVITGFWTAMVGLAGNQTITTVISPANGYGFPNPAEIQTQPLVQEVPMVNTWTPAAFGTNFSGVAAQTGSVFKDPFWGWTDVVLSENASAVVVESLPSVGEIVHPYGWPVTVTQVTSTTSSSGEITIDNDLTPSDVGQIKGTPPGSSSTFYLTDVNLAAGTFTLDYNTEVTGNTLIFTITVIDILP